MRIISLTLHTRADIHKKIPKQVSRRDSRWTHIDTVVKPSIIPSGAEIVTWV